MVAPASPRNDRNQSLDGLFEAADGTARIKLAIGSKAVSGITPNGAWQGVATHADGEAFVSSDGVVVPAGVDIDDGETVRPLRTVADGRQLVVVNPIAGVVTDGSGSITVGGTAQNAFSSNLDRKYLLVQNVSTTEDLWVNFGTAAVRDEPSIKLVPGAALLMDGSGFVTTQSVSVIATTAGHKFTAKQG